MLGVGEHNDVPRGGFSEPLQETMMSLIETKVRMRGAVRGRLAAIPISGEPKSPED